MRVLVSGASGFVGRHLCPHLRASGDEVVEAPAGFEMTDAAAVLALVERARPEGVIHLAGFSSVGKSHREPARTFAVNTLGAVHLLAALQQHARSARVVLISSGEMYGPVAPGARATEEHPLRPLNPYAASKAAAELAGFQFHRSAGLSVISARAFNHLGSGQRPNFAVPSFAAQIAAIARGDAEPVIRVGDLSPVRDFTHVEDVVEAYRLLLERGEAGEAYNVCSGEARSIGSLLLELLSISGVEARVEREESRIRAIELPSVVGDPGKLVRLGWRPSRTIGSALSAALATAAR